MQRDGLRKQVQMHENDNYFSKAQVLNGTSDPILRDYLRRSGSPLVTSYSSRSNGVRTSKETGQVPQKRPPKRRIRLNINGELWIHRVAYCLTIAGLTAVVAAIWG